MANMLDYLDWYGDFDFDTVPFNEVDNLILSQLAYLDLTGVVPPAPFGSAAGGDGVAAPSAGAKAGAANGDASTAASGPAPVAASEAAAFPSVTWREAWEAFAALNLEVNPADFGPANAQDTVELLHRGAVSGRRFADVRLSCCERIVDAERHEQFGALLAQLPDGASYVSYQGTDGTLIGWLEDCEISYRVVESQEDALAYLDLVASLTTGPLRVGGHSKGGNLAAFAAATCSDDVQNRIIEVWCNDSPGFDDRVVPLELFRPLADRIRLFTPEFDVVGALFDHAVESTVIKSSETAVMQHAGMSWQVMRGKLVRGDQLPVGSKGVNKAYDQLIRSHEELPERKKLLDDLYAELTAAGVTTIDDMLASGPQGIAKMMGSINSLDETDRKSMNDFLVGIMLGTFQGVVGDAVAPVAKSIGETLNDAAAATRASAEKALEDFRAQQRERAQARRTARPWRQQKTDPEENGAPERP